MNLARVNLPEIFKGKTKKEIKEMIENSIFNGHKKDIMLCYYIYDECMIDIAIKYGVNRKTIRKVLDDSIKEIG